MELTSTMKSKPIKILMTKEIIEYIYDLYDIEPFLRVEDNREDTEVWM
jgi:hypothetical protein